MRWPYSRVEFTRAGKVADAGQLQAARATLHRSPVAAPTDVLLIAHGWNNGVQVAEGLFTELCDNAAALAARRDGHRRWAVVGLVWPSVKWADEGSIAGHGLSAAGELPMLLDAISERVEDDEAAGELRDLAGRLDASPEARERFVARLRDLLPPDGEVGDDDPVPPALRSGAVGDLLATVGDAQHDLGSVDDPARVRPTQELPPGMAPDLLATTQATAAGFSLTDLDPKRLARDLLNLTTYYTMKARAGSVGTNGVAQLLRDLGTGPAAPRLHLAGHSFGARVVTSAAAATDVPVSSVTLLQAAFSHRSFSGSTTPPGSYRRLLEGPQLQGPVVVTHTHNDRAVGRAYAIASRLARQVGSGLGDADDLYGGLGANGAVATAETDACVIGDEHATYRFRPRRISNVLADRYVSGHGDVRNPAVANVLVHSMLTASADLSAAGTP